MVLKGLKRFLEVQEEPLLQRFHTRLTPDFSPPVVFLPSSAAYILAVKQQLTIEIGGSRLFSHSSHLVSDCASDKNFHPVYPPSYVSNTSQPMRRNAVIWNTFHLAIA